MCKLFIFAAYSVIFVNIMLIMSIIPLGKLCKECCKNEDILVLQFGGKRVYIYVKQ